MAKKCAMCGQEVKSGLVIHSECLDNQLLAIKAIITTKVQAVEDERRKMYKFFPKGVNYSDVQGQIKAYEDVLEVIKRFEKRPR